MAYASGAAAAAAAHKRRLEEEEEQMTPYSNEELENDWEFKIVRANYGAFGRAGEMQKLVDEEARAGWVLLEKLDNARVRFKRRRSAHANDARLRADGIDPYRAHYGMHSGLYALLIVAVTLLLTFGFILLLVLLSRIGIMISP